MLDSIQSLLDAFPEGVIQISGGLVAAANEKAHQYLPRLTPGAPLPVVLPLPAPGETAAGTFTSGPAVFSYSCKASEEDCVLLFQPEAHSALESWQLDGTLRQLRELLGDVLAEVGSVPSSETSAAFNKAFHRLFRLMSNLEFMQQAAVEKGISFQPITMDLDGLCRNVVQEAGDLLQEAGVSLEYTYRSKLPGLLISGDPRLLKKLLLGLISNAARAAGTGTVTVTLRRRENQVRILVSNSGPIPGTRQLNALFQGGPDNGLPLPGQGAGLGLSIARHIARLHGGTLLPFGGDTAPGVLLSLPIGRLDGPTSVSTPLVQHDGGLNQVLMELSDVLPESLFGLEGLD